MEEGKICSFFGHRKIEITEELYATLTAEILKSVDFGCRTFYFGGFGEFDALCHEIVTKIKNEKSELEIRRIFCANDERLVRKRHRYFNTSDYEDIIYLVPSFNGWYKSIYFRNCAMIDKSDRIIFYAECRRDSGAYKAFKYAKRKNGKETRNLWDLQSLQIKQNVLK